VGIDRGVHVLAATSDGCLFRNSAVGEKRKSATARLQRRLEATTVRSTDGRVLNRRDPVRLAAVKRLARSREREANARRDALHKISRKLVDGWDAIAMEALKLRAMTRSAKGTVERPGHNVRAKSALNRKILDASFGLLHQMIAYKAASAGTTIVAVDPRFSSQTCYKCGHCERENRRRRRFACRRCGFATHADIAAALEIRRRAQLALWSEPHAGQEPVTLHDVA
jgi:putative transposase